LNRYIISRSSATKDSSWMRKVRSTAVFLGSALCRNSVKIENVPCSVHWLYTWWVTIEIKKRFCIICHKYQLGIVFLAGLRNWKITSPYTPKRITTRMSREQRPAQITCDIGLHDTSYSFGIHFFYTKYATI